MDEIDELISAVDAYCEAKAVMEDESIPWNPSPMRAAVDGAKRDIACALRKIIISEIDAQK